MQKFVYSLILILVVGLISGCGGESVEELHSKGRSAFEERDYREAVNCYRKAIDSETTDRDLLFDCALAYRRLARYDSSMYFLKRADLLHPGDLEINEQIREVAISLGDWKNAVDAIRMLGEIKGTLEPYYEELSDLWLHRGQEGRAFYWARKALKKNPDLRNFYVRTANWAAQFDSLGVALELIDQAIERYGPEDEFLLNKAIFLARAGDFYGSEEILRALEQSNPTPMIRLTLAGVLESQSNPAKKREALAIYRAIKPSLPPESPIDSLITSLEQELE